MKNFCLQIIIFIKFQEFTESSWQVYADKSAFPMQTTCNHSNLLATKATGRFSVQQPLFQQPPAATHIFP